MSELLENLADHLGDHPILQALLAAFFTLILEDPTTITCGFLVADDRMKFSTAMAGLAFGITVGDLGLYALGRYGQPWVYRFRLVSEKRMGRVRKWFDNNLIAGIIVSRFVPGMRIPMFVGAGLFHAPFLTFLVTAIFASLAWTFFLLSLVILIGETILPLLHQMKWPVAISAVLLFVFFQMRSAKKQKRQDKETIGEPHEPVHSMFELWPPWVFYFPVAFYCIYLSLRYRGITLPTAANPSIYSGGLILESKSQIMGLVPEAHRPRLARYITVDIPNQGHSPEALFAETLQRLNEADLDYPLVAKPDIGQRGAGIQRVFNDDQLRQYIAHFPGGFRLMLQELIEYPNEAGVFYVRRPGQTSGMIFSVTIKFFPQIDGDGRSTLRELIQADPRASLFQDIYFVRHADLLDTVLADGEPFQLVFAGNHCQGAIFRDGSAKVSDAFKHRMLKIGDAIPDFHFGRFDVRYESLDSLNQGGDLRILEINGASSEATHIWDPNYRLRDAYASLFEQFRLVYEIGAINRRKGHKPLSLAQVLRDIRTFRKLARHYPKTH